MTAVDGLLGKATIAAACAALRLPRASYYRSRRARAPARKRPPPPRAIPPAVRREVRDLLVSPRFVDDAPPEIYAQLLDEGRRPCSVRSMYRILAEDGAIKERRAQVVRPAYAKPELLATAPNQVWTWDITKLRGPAKWTYFHLYVVLDLFSRYAVAWLVADRESAAYAVRLVREAVGREGVAPGELVVHADRGAAMRSKSLAQLCADLDVRRSFSRPHTSDDNPFIEASFKTMKYQPEFPDRFDSFSAAREFCRSYFGWYNREHRHSGIAFLTPETVYRGRTPEVLAARQATLDRDFDENPIRYANRRPRVAALPAAVYINPPKSIADEPSQVQVEVAQ
ncbi:MAG TPA: IS3 family transposase [Planctomycetota bacterium]|nr:IS3 family transposase [Planctomycetota bacterium]